MFRNNYVFFQLKEGRKTMKRRKNVLLSLLLAASMLVGSAFCDVTEVTYSDTNQHSNSIPVTLSVPSEYTILLPAVSYIHETYEWSISQQNNVKYYYADIGVCIKGNLSDDKCVKIIPDYSNNGIVPLSDGTNTFNARWGVYDGITNTSSMLWDKSYYKSENISNYYRRCAVFCNNPNGQSGITGYNTVYVTPMPDDFYSCADVGCIFIDADDISDFGDFVGTASIRYKLDLLNDTISF